MSRSDGCLTAGHAGSRRRPRLRLHLKVVTHDRSAYRVLVTNVAIDAAQAYLRRVGQIIRSVDLGAFDDVVSLFERARRTGSTIFFIGNGGSASTASHFATDLGVGSLADRQPFRVHSLTDNAAVITATGNDHGYDHVFVRQLRVLAQPDDVLVAISASGNSPNLVRAIEYAKTVPMTCVALTAFDGGAMRKAADLCLHVPTEIGEYGPAEDVHLMLNHALSLCLRDR